MNSEQVKTLQSTVLSNIERVDINEIDINKSSNTVSRASQFLIDIRNPYSFKCAQIAVNIKFTPYKKTLEKSLINYLTTKKVKAE